VSFAIQSLTPSKWEDRESIVVVVVRPWLIAKEMVFRYYLPGREKLKAKNNSEYSTML